MFASWCNFNIFVHKAVRYRCKPSNFSVAYSDILRSIEYRDWLYSKLTTVNLEIEKILISVQNVWRLIIGYLNRQFVNLKLNYTTTTFIKVNWTLRICGLKTDVMTQKVPNYFAVDDEKYQNQGMCPVLMPQQQQINK